MATDLDRGAYAGKETKFYYNSATNSSPTWVELKRARNIQLNRGAATSEVQFHGSDQTKNVHDYETISGSFEYVRKLGTDSEFTFLETTRDAKNIIELIHLNGPETVTAPADASKGWRAPVILGEFSESASGGDSVVVTIPFVLADAYTGAGAEVTISSYTGTVA